MRPASPPNVSLLQERDLPTSEPRLRELIRLLLSHPDANTTKFPLLLHRRVRPTRRVDPLARLRGRETLVNSSDPDLPDPDPQTLQTPTIIPSSPRPSDPRTLRASSFQTRNY